MGLDEQCRSIQGDFMKLPFEDNSFDGVYAIEATCHAPKRFVFVSRLPTKMHLFRELSIGAEFIPVFAVVLLQLCRGAALPPFSSWSIVSFDGSPSIPIRNERLHQ